MRSTTCYGNALFAENKLYELHNLYNKKKGLICGGRTCGEIRQLAHSRQFMFVKLQLFCDLLSSRKSPIF